MSSAIVAGAKLSNIRQMVNAIQERARIANLENLPLTSSDTAQIVDDCGVLISELATLEEVVSRILAHSTEAKQIAETLRYAVHDEKIPVGLQVTVLNAVRLLKDIF